MPLSDVTNICNLHVLLKHLDDVTDIFVRQTGELWRYLRVNHQRTEGTGLTLLTCSFYCANNFEVVRHVHASHIDGRHYLTDFLK